MSTSTGLGSGLGSGPDADRDADRVAGRDAGTVDDSDEGDFHDQPGSARRGRRLLGDRIRSWHVLVAVLAIVVLGAVATWLVAFSSVFGVQTVAVRGARVLNAAQVRSAAKVTLDAPTVRVDTAAIRRRVERLAVVASADVATSFPHTVTITVVERQPVGYLRSAGKVVLLDRTGLRYRTVRSAPKGLPRLVLPSGRSAASRSVATVAAALPATLRARVNSIQALAPNAITVVLRDGQLVQWGSATRNADKARVLTPLLRHHVAQVDVTDPDVPFTR